MTNVGLNVLVRESELRVKSCCIQRETSQIDHCQDTKESTLIASELVY